MNALRLPLAAAGLLVAVTPQARSGDLFTVQYPPSDQPGELALEARYHLWLPPTAKRIRAVIVHQHGCGDPAGMAGETAAHDLHWRALAARHDAALLSPHYLLGDKSCTLWCDPRNGSAATFERALADLANQTGHPELATAPWCLWGHSGGAMWVCSMLETYAPRIVAVFGRSGSARMRLASADRPPLAFPPEAFAVPVALNPGQHERGDKQFHWIWDASLKFFEEFRPRGAPVVLAPDPFSNHDCRNSRLFAIPFFDACLRLRLPASGKALNAVDLRRGLLADWEAATILKPADASVPLRLGWLPDAVTARAFVEYVKTGAVTDSTPPKRAPVITLAARGTKAAEVLLEWTAEADFESGVREFIIYRDGQEVARLGPPKARANAPFPQFQCISYHDTPEPPLAELKWRDPQAPPGQSLRYQVSFLNAAGLESPRSRPAKAKALR